MADTDGRFERVVQQLTNLAHRARLRSAAGTFLVGLATVLPIFLTVAIVIWMVAAAEAMMGALLRFIIPDSIYGSGMGLVAGLALIFVIGVLMQAFFFRRLVQWLDDVMTRIPLVKTVYGPLRDLSNFFARTRKRTFSKVVLVRWPGSEASLIGFVTVEDRAALPGPLQNQAQIAVYLPMSYQIGGYTVFLPAECLTPLDLSFEDAMRFVVTAGMSRPDEINTSDAPVAGASPPAQPPRS